MKTCAFSCVYNGYDQNTGERLSEIFIEINVRIIENGTDTDGLRAVFYVDHSYGNLLSVDTYLCTNPNYTQSDFFNDIMQYNLYSLATGNAVGATITIVNHLLNTQIASPVYSVFSRVHNVNPSNLIAKNFYCLYTYNVQDGLYTELIDNNNIFHQLNSIYQTNPPTYLSDDDFNSIMAIEKYNQNYFLNIISQGLVSDSSSDNSDSNVDLSTINTQLTNIANSLKVTETIDNEQVDKNITETLKEKELLVVNNLDISDKLSFKPKNSGYPDDWGVL